MVLQAQQIENMLRLEIARLKNTLAKFKLDSECEKIIKATEQYDNSSLDIPRYKQKLLAQFPVLPHDNSDQSEIIEKIQNLSENDVRRIFEMAKAVVLVKKV